MKIEYGAFQNCTSLKEIHFEKCNEAINTNIYKSNIPAYMKIIVNDKVFNQSLSVEFPANLYRLQRYSDYIQQKIDTAKNSNIVLSIIQLNKVIDFHLDENIDNIVQKIKNYLCDKYSITKEQIQNILILIDKKQEIENGS